VHFVGSVFSATMNSTHTCAIGMRSVLFANGMGLEINSQFQFYTNFFLYADALLLCDSFENYESLVCLY
jgi:hypothetical protein